MSLTNIQERQQKPQSADRQLPFSKPFGLPNTNPIATSTSPFQGKARVTPDKGSYGLQTIRMTALVGGNHREGFASAEMTLAQLQPEPRPTGPILLFEHIVADWNLTEADAASLLGLEDGSRLTEIYAGRRVLVGRDANDRLRLILRIAADLDLLFGETDSIRSWLDELQQDFGRRSPRSLLVEGSIENLLLVKDYVAYLSGR